MTPAELAARIVELASTDRLSEAQALYKAGLTALPRHPALVALAGQIPLPYDEAFYDSVRETSLRSAAVLLGLLRAHFPFESMIDLGAGVGCWIEVAHRLGVCDLEAVEGEWARASAQRFVDARWRYHDLNQEIFLDRRYDLAVSVEVAEHLLPTRSASFVADLCRASDCVVFAAALPRQGGDGHVSCRPHAWWAREFARHGYVCLDAFRPSAWHDPRVVCWYAQNTFLYVTAGHPLETRFPRASLLDVYHPFLVNDHVLRDHQAGIRDPGPADETPPSNAPATVEITAFGPWAQAVATRASTCADTGPQGAVLIVDEAHAANALVEAVRLRFAARPFVIMPLIDDTAAVRSRALSASLLAAAAHLDERRMLCDGFAQGTLTLNGRPQAEFFPRDERSRLALQHVMRLSHGVLARSRTDRERMISGCDVRPHDETLWPLTDRRVPAVRVGDTRDRVVVWAPDRRMSELIFVLVALADLHGTVSVVTTDTERHGFDVEPVRPEDAGPALQRARVIVDTATDAPDAACALACIGAPLVVSATCGACDRLDGAIAYSPVSWRSILGAVREALGAAPPRVRATAKTARRASLPAEACSAGPLVSIVVPTYNRPRFLRRALASIERQQHAHLEIVVVNDAGADVSDVVAAFPRARLLTHASNRGLGAARNTGVAAARGAFIGFLDDDDALMPDHLTHTVAALRQGRIDIVHTDFMQCFISENERGEWKVEALDVLPTRLDTRSMQVENGLGYLTVLARAEVFREAAFDPDLAVAEDYDMWLRLSRVHDFAHVALPTALYTVTGASMMDTRADRFEAAYRTIYARHVVDDAPALAARRTELLARLSAGAAVFKATPRTRPLAPPVSLAWLDGLPPLEDR